MSRYIVNKKAETTRKKKQKAPFHLGLFGRTSPLLRLLRISPTKHFREKKSRFFIKPEKPEPFWRSQQTPPYLTSLPLWPCTEKEDFTALDLNKLTTQ